MIKAEWGIKWAKELLELSHGWVDGFGFEEFRRSKPSPELYFYVKSHGWDEAVDNIMKFA